jgi:hypothetical protein
MKAKEFDCVQMKYDIQQEILRDFAGLSPDERRRRTEEMIAVDPILAGIWHRALAETAGAAVTNGTSQPS